MSRGIVALEEHKAVGVRGDEAKVLSSDSIAAVVARMLERKGYTTHRHYVVEGVGGIKHVVDVFAEKEPLPRTRVRIAIWIHQGRLTKDNVETYIARKALLPVDKVIVVVLKDVEPEAYALAHNFDIDVLSLSEDLKFTPEAVERGVFRELHIHPSIDYEHALGILKDKIRPGLFRKRICKPEGYARVYLPLVSISVEIPVRRYGEEELTVEETTLTFDGVEGYAVVPSNGTIGIEESMGSFSEISQDAIEVLRRLSIHNTVSMSELATSIGISEARLKAVLDSLASKSLVDIFGDLAELRYTLLTSFADPLKIARERGADVRLGAPLDKEGIVVPLRANISRLTELVEALQGRILDTSVIYYPLYVLSCRENGHQVKIIAIDGLSGEESGGLVKLLSMREVLDIISSGLRPFEKA